MTITEDNVFVSDKKGQLDDSQASLGHLLMERLDSKPEKVVYIDYASGREWTAAKLKDSILNIGTCLIKDYGLKQGDVVCISFDWCDWTNILAISIICAGATVCCHYPKDPYDELLSLAKKVEPKLMFCHGANIHWVDKLQEEMGYKITGVEMDAKTGDSRRSLQHLLNFHRNGECLVPVACRDLKSDIAIISMSSGTTGRPKAIPYTHFNALADFTLGADEDRNIVTACTSPIDYVSGRLVSLNCITNRGVRGIIINGFKPKPLLEAVERYRIQGLQMGVGSFCNLIGYEHLDKYDISSLAMICATGSKLNYKTELNRFLARHPHIYFWVQTYGTSETATVALKFLTSQQMLSDSNNCGHLKPGVRVRIVDRDTGKNLGVNEPGSVRVWSESVFPGFIDKARTKATMSNGKLEFIREPATFDELGYYITGDIGYFSQDEELFIEGREKELLVCRGQKKVLPQELEDVLLLHPAVLSACVFGVKQLHNSGIDCPRAFIKLKPEYYAEHDAPELATDHTNGSNGSADAEEEVLEFSGRSGLCSLPEERRRQVCRHVMAFVNRRVGWKKQLTGGLAIVDEMKVLSASGKVDKMYLRSLSLDEVEIYGDRSGQM